MLRRRNDVSRQPSPPRMDRFATYVAPTLSRPVPCARWPSRAALRPARPSSPTAAGVADFLHQQVGRPAASVRHARRTARRRRPARSRRRRSRRWRGQRRQREILRIQLARLSRCRRKISPRASGSGRSTKKISSKRPLRSSSGGSSLTSLAVATRNTRDLALGHPGQQVAEHAPRHAAVLAAAGAGQALLDLVDPQHARRQLLGRGQRARAGSSRSRRGTCCRACRSPGAAAAHRSRRRWPWPAATCRSPARPAAARPWADPAPAARCRRRTPSRRCSIQRFRRPAPATSAKRAVSYSKCRWPLRLSSSNLSLASSGRSVSLSAPSRKISCRAMRRASPSAQAAQVAHDLRQRPLVDFDAATAVLAGIGRRRPRGPSSAARSRPAGAARNAPPAPPVPAAARTCCRPARRCAQAAAALEDLAQHALRAGVAQVGMTSSSR